MNISLDTKILFFLKEKIFENIEWFCMALWIEYSISKLSLFYLFFSIHVDLRHIILNIIDISYNFEKVDSINIYVSCCKMISLDMNWGPYKSLPKSINYQIWYHKTSLEINILLGNKFVAHISILSSNHPAYNE